MRMVENNSLKCLEMSIEFFKKVDERSIISF